jgi:lipopolysaccharide export LptBFGC system permease protein LptF
LFARAARRPAAAAGGLAWLLLTLGGLGQVLVASSLAPAPPLLLRLLLGVAGAMLPLAVGIGALAGAAGGMAALRESGALLGLAALGANRGVLALSAMLFALPLGATWLAVAHLVEPMARAGLRDARAEALASVQPAEGRTARIGAWWVALDAGRLHFTDGQRRGSASEWALAAREGGVEARLGDLMLEDGPTTLTARDLLLPIAVANRGKVHVTERSTPDLLARIERDAALGREGYERWMLHKRSALPCALLPLAVAGAGLARRRPPGVVVGFLMGGTWALIRILDAQIGAVQAPIADLIVAILAAFTAALAWR